MFDIIKRKNLFLMIGSITVALCIATIAVLGLNAGIDFTGGSIVDVQSETCAQDNCEDFLRSVFLDKGIEVHSVVKSGENDFQVKTKAITQEQWTDVKSKLSEEYPDFTEQSFETIGPTLGQELLRKTAVAIFVASVLLLIYIAWRFEERIYGVAAVVAMIHDILVILATFAIFGKLWDVEIDVMFVTAALTSIAFSVHDTIVLYDRVRETLRRNPKSDFPHVVNLGINSTIVRSLSTSLTIVLVLTALMLLGGENIRWFVAALIVGTLTGVYSSPFIAAPLVVFLKEKMGKKKGLLKG
ncbi:protein translocase subunit SecF [candidate division WWE3 bacterium]|uniref:Protein-export membrane protein SecF n=1 Tax=candidate division WWE3 bacterium TaxID=2053526 RepID=A0A955RSC4_UNCKA|nr:protein translocase subunit SecF [candidate division WWE3 bacterium]